MSTKGIRILKVKRGSAAEAIGLGPGDRILTVNGREVSDVLALRFHLAEERVVLQILRPDGARKYIRTELSGGTSLGVAVEEFKTRTCDNSCVFCFVDQLPPGARPALRLKDDDYRLSFLHGNYITLTNLPPAELDRIIEQKLSPLYVSVHATDPVLRAWMLGRKKADDLEGKLQKLIRGGIKFHAQIVLIPGINDGKHLENTLFDLVRLHPGIQSVAIVPIGLSDHGKPKDSFAPVTPAFSRRLIRKLSGLQESFRKQTGQTFAYLADEFYIQAGRNVPDRVYYDGFAQIEDGVGMVRNFLDDFDAELSRRTRQRLSLRGTVVTGRLFYPALSRCIRRFNRKFGCSLKVCMAENRFLGKRITVAGLLAGRDILQALKGKDPGDFVIIPAEALSRTDRILVDDLSLRDLSDGVGKPVFSSGRTVGDFFDLAASG